MLLPANPQPTLTPMTLLSVLVRVVVHDRVLRPVVRFLIRRKP